jgi:hypothetical protein
LTHPPDRDMALDRILRRLAPAALDHALRGAGDADEAPTSEDCLDAETVAVMADGGLLPHEKTAAEQHASTCARCQAVIAAVIRTTPEPPPQRAWWRMPSLRWVAPLAATGLAVAVWVAVGVRAPNVTSQSVPVDAPEKKALQVAPPPGDARRNLQEERQAKPALGDIREAAPKVLPQSVPPKRDRSEATTPIDQLASAKRKDEVPLEKSAAQAPAAMPGPPAIPELPAVTPTVPATAPPTAGAIAGAGRGAAGNAVRTGAFADRASAAAPVESVTVSIADIASPNPRSRWRILGASVQRSIDEGATWTTQVDLKTVRLMAGSAPEPDVCWVVGDNGMVLVTVNGLSWQYITAPVQTGLVSVKATSADVATVTTSDGRTFATTDRGRTWTPR